MANFKTVVRKVRADGFYPVYIRVSHHRETAYIKTDKMITKKELYKGNIINNPYVSQFCAQKILEYNELLNQQNIELWTVKDVVNFLLNGHNDICFSDYARQHIGQLIDNGQIRTAKNYRNALHNIELFANTNRIMFSSLNTQYVNKWIKSLESTRRAKEMYPICMRQVFKAAMLEYNDYDTGLMRIKNNPWMKVSIPQSDRPEKIAISPEACREFFSFPLPDSRMKLPIIELGRDVAMMVLCLAGINTIDLFEMRKQDYKDGILRYQRAKTKKARADGAYMEMKVPAIIQALFEKYGNHKKDDDHLLNFYQRMSTPDSFCANVNSGIKKVCELMGIPKVEGYSVYTFRHTWGTVAQNDIKASIEQVAFAMNHASAHRVTRGYIKTDYAPAWELNEKVVDFIFFTDNASSQEQKTEESRFRLSYRFMVNAAAYYNGRKLAELTDVGFNNVDEVIARLATMLPGDIPYRATLLFKIVNLDKNQTVVYQRQKGKGF